MNRVLSSTLLGCEFPLKRPNEDWCALMRVILYTVRNFLEICWVAFKNYDDYDDYDHYEHYDHYDIFKHHQNLI